MTQIMYAHVNKKIKNKKKQPHLHPPTITKIFILFVFIIYKKNSPTKKLKGGDDRVAATRWTKH
jgi:hypothetical protein